MSLATDIVDRAEPRGHYVQFFKADEPSLNRNVSYYLWEGLLRGEGLVVFSTGARRDSLTGQLERLGVDMEEVIGEGQLVFRDALRTLSRILRNDEPNGDLFDREISEVLRSVRPRVGNSVRVYGEMVGLLWEQGRFDAAIRLEECWNGLIASSGITLFCGYPIDMFTDQVNHAGLRAVIERHAHLMPTGEDRALENAVRDAMQEVLGIEAEALRLAAGDHTAAFGARMNPAEASILWLRHHLPGRADEIISNARSRYAEKSRSCAA